MRRSVSRLLTTAVTPSESASNDISSVPKRTSPPSFSACSRRTGSRSFWLHRHHEEGLKRARPPPGSISLNSHSPASPTREGACRMPWFPASVAAAPRTSRSTPATRSSSIVRTLFPRPRGWTEVPACRSTSVCRTPSRPRNSEVDRPTREPPTMRTGTSRPARSACGFISSTRLQRVGFTGRAGPGAVLMHALRRVRRTGLHPLNPPGMRRVGGCPTIVLTQPPHPRTIRDGSPLGPRDDSFRKRCARCRSPLPCRRTRRASPYPPSTDPDYASS